MNLTKNEIQKLIEKYKEFENEIKTYNLKNKIKLSFNSNFFQTNDNIINIIIYVYNNENKVYVGGCGCIMSKIFEKKDNFSDNDVYFALDILKNKENILKEIKAKNDQFNKELADILGEELENE